MIEKIIFDYGGVFTKHSRSSFVARSLGATSEHQTALLNFFRSEFIRHAAEGKYSTKQIISRLQDLLGDVSASTIQDVLSQSCEPDIEFLSVLNQLKVRYRVFVISDSLPPYSTYVTQNLAHTIDDFFMSDQLGSRKSGQLFALTESVHPGLFVNSVYIDDRESNLAEARRRGAAVLLFKSTKALVEDLHRLGVDLGD